MAMSIHQFNSINNCNLNQLSVFCCRCESVLDDTIYLTDDGNLCFKCKTLLPFNIQRNYPLEDLLKSALFNCSFGKCSYIGRRDELKAHRLECAFAPFPCPFCQDQIIQLSAVQHLQTIHSQHITKLKEEEPMFTLEIKTDEYYRLFICNVRNVRTFLVSVRVNQDIIYIDTAKVTRWMEPFDQGYNGVLAFHKHGKNEYKMRNTIRSVKEMLLIISDSKTIGLITQERKERRTFTLYFGQYDMVNNDVVGKCPLCKLSYSNDVYQCSQGHCVCKVCLPLIVSKCPICVGTASKFVLLKYVLPNQYVRCDNFEMGCIDYYPRRLLDNHLKICTYKELSCVWQHCKVTGSRYTLWEHLLTHEKIENGTMLTSELNLDDPIEGNPMLGLKLIQFGELTFLVRCAIVNNMLHYNVTLPYHFLDPGLFRYEVHFYNINNNKLILKGGNFVQPYHEEPRPSWVVSVNELNGTTQKFSSMKLKYVYFISKVPC